MAALDAQSRKHTFGVDNAERVRKIYDYGEGFYRDQAKSNYKLPYSAESVDYTSLIAEIETELDAVDNFPCFSDPQKTIIPREDFLKILTPKRVLQLVSALPCFRGTPDMHQVAHRIYFGSNSGSNTIAPCLKLLGVLIGSGKANEIEAHMADGLNDDCLPLRYNYDHRKAIMGETLICRHHGVSHKIFKGYRRKAEQKAFVTWTFKLTAPYITNRDELHSHYILEQGDPLPMLLCEKVVDQSQTDGQHDMAYGGFSDVYKVTICRSHSNLKSQGIVNPRGHYALKKLTSHDRQHFNLELSSLLFSADQGGNKKHMIQLLATFEECNPVSQQSTYYLLFDWAYGNLTDFWNANPTLIRDKSHCIWMAVQFHGLAEALQTIHNDRKDTLKYLPGEMSDPNLYGRHGDIKPTNLLCFVADEKQMVKVLTLADFGLGRLHTRVSRSKQNPAELARTATYRPPEFDLIDGLVSPASDVFSLGCVFLEHISWYFKGPDAVLNEFPDWRMEKDIHTFEADTFFRITTDATNGRQLSTLKPQVREWIKSLKDDRDCTPYLEQMLELIEEKMLDPDPKTRIRAMPLERELLKMKRGCERDSSFYMKRVKTIYELEG